MGTFITVCLTILFCSWVGKCFMKGFNEQVRKNELAQMRKKNAQAALRLKQMELEMEKEEAEEAARRRQEMAERRAKGVNAGLELMRRFRKGGAS
jgi:hypothetical protein